MKYLQHLLLLICSVGLTLPLFAHDDPYASAAYTVTELGHGIYRLEAMGGNIGLSVGEDGAFLIDDQYAPLAPKLRAAISKLTGQPVKFVINTHWHGDHTGGNASLAGTGTIVVAHENVRARMAAPGPKQAKDAALPILTFSDTTTYHLNGLKIHAFHVPKAHTDGDAIIHFPEVNIIHAGDILFNGLYPFIDLDSGGSVEGFLAAMERLVSLSDDTTQIIAGHGPLGSKADVEKSMAMIRDSRERVAQLVEAGKSLEEIQALDPLAPYHKEWSWRFIDGKRMTETLYRDLTD